MIEHPTLADLRNSRRERTHSHRLKAVRFHLERCPVCQAELYFPESEEESQLLRDPSPVLARALRALRSQPIPLPRASVRIEHLASQVGREVVSMLEALAKPLGEVVDAALAPTLVPARALSTRGKTPSRSAPKTEAPRTREALCVTLARALREHASGQARLAAAALALEAGDAPAALAAVERLPRRSKEAILLRAWYSAFEGNEARLKRHLDALARTSPKDARRIRDRLSQGAPFAKVFLGKTVERYVIECSRRISLSP